MCNNDLGFRNTSRDRFNKLCLTKKSTMWSLMNRCNKKAKKKKMMMMKQEEKKKKNTTWILRR